MRVLRATMWTPELEPISMVMREVDLGVPLDEAAEEQRILPGGFVCMDIFEVDDDADIMEATMEATRRQQEVIQREHDQALLYYWDASKFGQLAAGGVLTGTLPCPLSAAEIEIVLIQLAAHPEYRGQTIIAIAEDHTVVMMKDGTARREDLNGSAARGGSEGA